MIRRVLVQSDAHKAPQRQRVRQPPGNPALRPDALEIPDQQRPKVNPRRQRRTPVLGRIELRTPLLDKLVEALGLQQLIQTLIKRMPWSRRQLGVRDPDLLLLLPLLARPHRHAPILQTNSVDTVKVLAYEPGLAPRAAKGGAQPPGSAPTASRRAGVWPATLESKLAGDYMISLNTNTVNPGSGIDVTAVVDRIISSEQAPERVWQQHRRA